MQSNTLTIDSPQRPHQPLSRSRSIRELSQRHSSSKSDKNTSIHSRIRKASAHEFAKEIELMQASRAEEKHPPRAMHSASIEVELPKQALRIDEKDVFLKSRIYDQLQTHFQRLEKQSQPLKQEQLQELEYTTFRMIKKQQKCHLSQLREKLLPKHSNKH